MATPREVVEQLKQLAALRERLVETRKRLLTPVNEFRQYGDVSMAKNAGKSQCVNPLLQLKKTSMVLNKNSNK
jgi:hypothetical protein